jgi:hypothetical protein
MLPETYFLSFCWLFRKAGLLKSDLATSSLVCFLINDRLQKSMRYHAVFIGRVEYHPSSPPCRFFEDEERICLGWWKYLLDVWGLIWLCGIPSTTCLAFFRAHFPKSSPCFRIPVVLTENSAQLNPASCLSSLLMWTACILPLISRCHFEVKLKLTGWKITCHGSSRKFDLGKWRLLFYWYIISALTSTMDV